MAPPLAWIEICTSQELEVRHVIGVRPPLTKRRLLAAAAKKIKGISKQSSAYNGVSGKEITDELTAAEIESAHFVLTLTGKWEHHLCPNASSSTKEPLAYCNEETIDISESNEPLASCNEETFDMSECKEPMDSVSMCECAGYASFASTEKSSHPWPMHEKSSDSCLVDVPLPGLDLTSCLSDELLLRLSGFLEAPSLLRTACSCRLWQDQTLACVDLWRGLCEELLGKTLLKVHQIAWAQSAEAPAPESARFFRCLIRAAFHCASFTHNPSLRHHCLQHPEFSDNVDSVPSHMVQQVLGRHLCVSGHSAVTLENLVVIIGGWRKRRPEVDVHLYVVDIAANGGPCLKQPVLVAKSARPERRLRHSCCVIQPAFTPLSAFHQKCILMLGGCQDQTHTPLPGLHVLNILSFTKPDGSEACWYEVSASGTAPRAIWHHTCGSFAKGKKVVVFGGDFPASDAEFAEIKDRYSASFVYVLDVDRCCWERVQTKGLHPSWRSLHTGVIHTSLRDVTERLVIFGGCAEHTEIFNSGDVVDMCGYALDLHTWTWLRGPGESEFHHLPSGRMRVAAERFGPFLVLYGGHGDGDEDTCGDVDASEKLLKLDLLTLSWSQAALKSQAFEYQNSAAATLAGGVIFGGVQLKNNTIRLIPKFEFLHLEL